MEYWVHTLILAYWFTGVVQVHRDFSSNIAGHSLYTLLPKPTTTLLAMLTWPRMAGKKSFGMFAVGVLIIAVAMWVLGLFVEQPFWRNIIISALIAPSAMRLLSKRG